jgi:hypothetical protein
MRKIQYDSLSIESVHEPTDVNMLLYCTLQDMFSERRGILGMFNTLKKSSKHALLSNSNEKESPQERHLCIHATHHLKEDMSCAFSARASLRESRLFASTLMLAASRFTRFELIAVVHARVRHVCLCASDS